MLCVSNFFISRNPIQLKAIVIPLYLSDVYIHLNTHNVVLSSGRRDLYSLIVRASSLSQAVFTLTLRLFYPRRSIENSTDVDQ